jgi:hypothetical protein
MQLIGNALVRILFAALALTWPAAQGWAKNTGFIFVSSEDDDIVTVLEGGTLKKVKDIPTA